MAPPPYLTLPVVPMCELCNDAAVMRCAWCTKSLCMKQFFTDYHFCSQYSKWEIANKKNILKMTQKSIKMKERLKTRKIRKIYIWIDTCLILVGYSWVRRRARCGIINTDNRQMIIVVIPRGPSGSLQLLSSGGKVLPQMEEEEVGSS